MWRNELKKRDEEYWKGQTKRDDDLAKMLEGLYKAIQETLVSKDKDWLDILDSYNHHLNSLYFEQINMRKNIESIALRQGDLIRSNVDMLAWAIRTISRKKKYQCQKLPFQTLYLMSLCPPNGKSFEGPLETQEPSEF